jgi:hypothetical protein
VGQLWRHKLPGRSSHNGSLRWLTIAQPFTAYFLGADIHELLSPDLLHQIIKGTFKDHLVDWVKVYINSSFERTQAARILADIDRRYAQKFLTLFFTHT